MSDLHYYGRYAAAGLLIGGIIIGIRGCGPAPATAGSATTAPPAPSVPTATDGTGSAPSLHRNHHKYHCDSGYAERHGGGYTMAGGGLCVSIKHSDTKARDKADNLQASINDVSARSGVSGALLNAIAGMESSYGRNARTNASGARGDFQILDSTYAELKAEHGHKYGLTDEPATDVYAGAAMAAEYVKDNTRFLAEVIGRQPTLDELYMAHMLGATGASRIITADSDVEAGKLYGQAAVENNRNAFYSKDGPRTVAEFRDYIQGRMQENMADHPYRQLASK